MSHLGGAPCPVPIPEIKLTQKVRKSTYQSSLALSNFIRFPYVVLNILFGKVAFKIISLRPATLLKKRLWHKCFPVNFVKFLRTPFFTEQLWWLLPTLDQVQ